MASAIVSYAPWLAWAFVPPLATKYTLDFLYSARLVARPASPSIAQAHATRTRILLIAAYLIYQFTTSLSSSSTEPTAYRLLEVGVESDIETIKRSFRRLAKIHHPDKVGPSGERFFIALRRSHDVLTDSVRRFAYDRFGIAVLDWRGALTVREYMVIGLRESLLFWLVNSAIFAVLSWLNGAGAGKAASPWSYWHLTLLFSLSSLELYLITTPTRPRLVRRFLPRHTSGDVVAVLRQTYTSTIMAMRQILPLLGEAGGSGGGEIMTLAEANKFIEALAGEMDKLGVGAVTMRRQSDLAVTAELEPLRAAATSLPSSNNSNDGALRQRSPLELSYVNHVTQSLINRSLQASPEVQRAIAERRRMQAAAGEEEATTFAPTATAVAAEASSSSPSTAAAQPALPPHVANEAGAGALPSPPASPKSVASGKSLQPRVSERRSSLSSSKDSHRRRSGGGGGGSRDIRDLASELTGGEGQGQQDVLGLDVSKEGAIEHSAAGLGVDHSREVPPYPQSPKLGGEYTMIS